MFVVVLAMIVTLGLALGTAAVVVMGLQQRGRGLAPVWGRRFSRLAEHLNGDADTPLRVQHVADRLTGAHDTEPVTRREVGEWFHQLRTRSSRRVSHRTR